MNLFDKHEAQQDADLAYLTRADSLLVAAADDLTAENCQHSKSVAEYDDQERNVLRCVCGHVRVCNPGADLRVWWHIHGNQDARALQIAWGGQ